MADIDQIIAGGQGASSRADFSGLADIPKAYWEGRNQAYTQEGRDLFKGGIPTIQNPDGTTSVNYGAIRDALFQHGDIGQGVSVDNLDLARQKLKFGQQLNETVWPGSTGVLPSQQPVQQPPVISPSSNRSAPAVTPSAVTPPQNSGGVQPQAGSPRGDQPGSIVSLIQGRIPDELAGPIIGQVSAMAQLDSNVTIPPEKLPRIKQVVDAAIARLTGGGVSPAQAGPQASPQAPPQAPPQAGLQVSGPGGGVVQPDAQGVYPRNSMITAGGPPPPVMAQGPSVPPQAGSSAPIQPTPVPTQAITQDQPGLPASRGPTDPTLGGLVPPGRTPEQQVTLLRRAIGTGLLEPNVEKLYQEQINAITTRLAPTEQEKAYDAARRNPGLDPYIARTEAQKAATKAIAEGDVKEQEGFITAGRDASRRLTTLNTVSNIIQNDKSITLGFGADTALKVKKALQQIGFDVGDLSGAQAIEKLNGMLAAESAKTISPRPAQFEFKTFLNNNPGLNVDRAGNIRVLGIFSQLAKRDLDLGKLARQNRGDWQNWDNVVENYDKLNPIVDPTTRTPISTDTVIAPDTARKSVPATTVSVPPPNAASALRANPALRDQFEAKYGPGSAAAVLGAR